MIQFAPLHNTTLIGSDVEQKCLEHLSQQGLKKIAKNFRSKLGEIDLIMKDNETIAFIEVRYRKKRHYGTPEETIDYYKRKKIILTAQYYLQKHSKLQKLPCRFDILGVSTYNHMLEFNWLKGAFTLDDI